MSFSTRDFTDCTRITSRTTVIFSGSSSPSRRMVSMIDGIGRAAHLLDGFAERQALHLLAVELGDDVAGQDAGLVGRRVVDRRDHLDELVLHGDLDAEPEELAAGLHLHVLIVFGVQVARMRIERGQHAVDRRLDQICVIGLLDIVGADALEHVAEQIELPVGVGRRRGGAVGAAILGDASRRQCAGESAGRQ